MSQDIIADALNQIMNAKRVKKKEIKIKRVSNPLINLLKIMKEKKHIDFHVINDEKFPYIIVKILNINECKAIKPRFYVTVREIDKYLRRFLPSRNFGTLIISTSKGLIDQKKAEENKIGGSLIAYFY